MKRIFIFLILLFLLKFAHAQSEVEKYKCIEVKTDLVGDKVQYSIKKENSVEFALKNCLPQNLDILVEGKKITYEKSKRLVEDGRIEKNDLFSVECYEPFFEEDLYYYRITNQVEYFKYIKSRNHRFHFGKISPLITPDYPLYPTIKQTAERVSLKIPHRVFVIMNFSGGASHEFFCYLDGEKINTQLKDKCVYPFEQVLDIHIKNNNYEAIKALAEKYFKRLDYEKAENTYRKLMELSKGEDYEGLLSFYMATQKYTKAEELLLKKIDESPFDARLYILIADLYLRKGEYYKAKLFINKAFKLRIQEEEYKAYGILGEIHIAEGNFKGAILSLKRASELFKEKCEQQKLLTDFFRKDNEPIDCELQALPYDLKIIYSLTGLGDFQEAEKMAKELLSKKQDNPYVFAYLSSIYAGMGEFEKAIDASDKAISLFKKGGIGANIVMGEIYPLVVSVYRNTPAEKAGLKRGDKIINIGDKDLRLYRDRENIMKMLFNYVGSNEELKLKIHRDNSSKLKELKLRKSEFLDSESSQVLAFRAILSRAMGNRAEFTSFAKKAYELNPNDKLSQITMALLKADTGNAKGALKLLEITEDAHNRTLPMLIKTLVYAKTGKINKAREIYSEIPQDIFQTRNILYRKFLAEIEGIIKKF